MIRTSDAADDFGRDLRESGQKDGLPSSPPSIVAATPVDEPPPPPSPGLLRALEKMRSVFHIRDLRPGQAEIIESVLAGRDTLAIMPTGSGKSLTYQLPALVLEGPTLVVSPLLALIEDQYSKLKAAGVEVVRIDSTRTAKERAADLAAVREGTIKLVMITPESVNSPTVQEALAGVKFSLFCVDEAHCVSQWGHDFRPAYLGLRRAAQVLGRPPILGLTATATPAIGDDVLVQLGMKDPKVCRVSFHRPNLAFDVRKVAGEADKLRQLGKLISRLRRPGIVYCATVRAVDELYVALRHGKIPVERYNGKMTQDEREKSQASFMQSGRKVVMLATNAFGLGIDKPDIRYIIHYQMPGSPESYVQEAGRAGRDGKPSRCVLLFQPDDISIQEHFLKEAHPTKSQARMVAEGLYAWSDEGKEVSVRDLAMSMALPERRVRVILSVLEAMGVAEEVKAARWKGVEPRPTREQIDKAAMVFEARRISDRRRLESLLKYMNTQRCRVQMLRAYFGEPEGEKCGLCDSDAGLDSEVFDTASSDERHGLHAATDFHARPRRRRRGRAGYDLPAPPPPAAPHAAARAGHAALRDGDPDRPASAAGAVRDSSALRTGERLRRSDLGRRRTDRRRIAFRRGGDRSGRRLDRATHGQRARHARRAPIDGGGERAQHRWRPSPGARGDRRPVGGHPGRQHSPLSRLAPGRDGPVAAAGGPPGATRLARPTAATAPRRSPAPRRKAGLRRPGSTTERRWRWWWRWRWWRQRRAPPAGTRSRSRPPPKRSQPTPGPRAPPSRLLQSRRRLASESELRRVAR